MRKGLSCIGLWLCLLLIIGCSNSDSQPENVEVYLEANTGRVLLKEEGGTAYINIASNTRWTILVENDEIPVIDLDVTPLAGDGDGTIKITYGREINKVQCEHATLIFYYYSEGKRVSKEVILTRQENDGNKDEEGWKTFTTFAKATNSLLVEDFLIQGEKDKSYIIGQGLSLSEYHQVLDVCAKQNIELLDIVNYSNSASLITTHKHNHENVLISKPNKLEENIYLSELIVFQNNELIIDHQTGLHVQGMVLIEAIRQMFIAVVEKFFQKKRNHMLFLMI